MQVKIENFFFVEIFKWIFENILFSEEILQKEKNFMQYSDINDSQNSTFLTTVQLPYWGTPLQKLTPAHCGGKIMLMVVLTSSAVESAAILFSGPSKTTTILGRPPDASWLISYIFILCSSPVIHDWERSRL